MFRELLNAWLHFPCDKDLLTVLDRYYVKLHQLTPNAIIQLVLKKKMPLFNCSSSFGLRNALAQRLTSMPLCGSMSCTTGNELLASRVVQRSLKLNSAIATLLLARKIRNMTFQGLSFRILGIINRMTIGPIIGSSSRLGTQALRIQLLWSTHSLAKLSTLI